MFSDEEAYMAQLYYETDADPGRLVGKTVAVPGYGSQGHAPMPAPGPALDL